MSIDYLVSSLPPLAFGDVAPISWQRFIEFCGEDFELPQTWLCLETQLRNAIVEMRGGKTKDFRKTDGCSIYWKNRIQACFQETDVMKREDLLDHVWWDAASELIPPSQPLGFGALAAYAVRLRIALKRAKISSSEGNAAFDRLTNSTRM